MRSFHWEDRKATSLRDRYGATDDVAGLDAWERGSRNPHFPDVEEGWKWLDEIRSRRRPLVCPRVFISHRQSDVKEALKVAWYVHQEGFDVWLDAIDLPPGTPAGLNAANQAFVIAAIIEMALINCTHLIAVTTRNTVGSQWVPYEYGRVKDDPPARVTTSAWIEPTKRPTAVPEYMYLAPMFDTRLALQSWLRVERAGFAACIRLPDWAPTWLSEEDSL